MNIKHHDYMINDRTSELNQPCKACSPPPPSSHSRHMAYTTTHHPDHTSSWYPIGADNCLPKRPAENSARWRQLASLRKASTHVFIRRSSCCSFATGSRGRHSAPVASCKLLVTVLLCFIGPAKRLQPTAM
jgi:hypothetical protein